MTGETYGLAEFASGVTYKDIPKEAISSAKAAITDAIAVGVFGSELPWSQILAPLVDSGDNAGSSPVLGRTFTLARARDAALINGTFIHSFEFDSLRYPNAGVHAGSTVWPAVFAIGCQKSSSGEEALTAFVAGCEVAFRVGLAGKGAFEALGFHAPGITGVFGAAAAAGKLLGLDARRMANAFGIAGSMCGGLLAFSKAASGGAVKPLHMGRAAESGVLAALMAECGYEGPQSVLEGKFGTLDAYAQGGNAPALIEELGTRWETQKICIKKYPCHVMAQTVVEGVRELVRQRGLDPGAIATISLGVAEKVLSHHSNRNPMDVSTSQYSVPMCAAIALFRDPSDPQAFLSRPFSDPDICGWARRIELFHLPETGSPGYEWASTIRFVLKSGEVSEVLKKGFGGTSPLQAEELARSKFGKLTDGIAWRDDLLRELTFLENVDRLSSLFVNRN